MPRGDQQNPPEGEPRDFKDRISPAAIRRLSSELLNAWDEFPGERFISTAESGLAALGMKQRVVQVADALAAVLPPGFPDAAKVLENALDSATFDGWIVYPVDDFVARYGIDFPEVSLPLLGRLTSRWSCEFAIRPLIERHPDITFECFDRWAQSDDEHRRRLVSEGSRPRLPWGDSLHRFREDPAPTIALLDRLVDDPSQYVRKSVANHLNDIARDHPDLAVETGRRWLEGGGDTGRRRWIVTRGMRTLVKQGDPAALALLGYDPDAAVEISGFSVEPDSVAIGEPVTIAFSLEAVAPTPVIVDYRIHHAAASGGDRAKAARPPKVFKLKTVNLEPGVEQCFEKRHRIRQVSVRRIHPGPHLVEVQVNGRVRASATVEVKPAVELA